MLFSNQRPLCAAQHPMGERGMTARAGTVDGLETAASTRMAASRTWTRSSGIAIASHHGAFNIGPT